MNKIWKRSLYAIITFFTVACIFHLTHKFYTEGNAWYLSDYEKICYLLLYIVFTMFFNNIIDKFKHLWAKATTGVSTSLLFTTVIFMVNNFWRYICINNRFNWKCPISLGVILRHDITYTYGWGEYRYLLVFFAIFITCCLKIFLSHPKVKAMLENWENKFYDWVYIKELKKENISDLYQDVIENPNKKRLVDYVRNLPVNDNEKKALMLFIDEHRDRFLIYLLLVHFEELITKEEYIKYKQEYVDDLNEYIQEQKGYYSVARVECPEMFKKLDEKFHVDSIE